MRRIQAEYHVLLPPGVSDTTQNFYYSFYTELSDFINSGAIMILLSLF